MAQINGTCGYTGCRPARMPPHPHAAPPACRPTRMPPHPHDARKGRHYYIRLCSLCSHMYPHQDERSDVLSVYSSDAPCGRHAGWVCLHTRRSPSVRYTKYIPSISYRCEGVSHNDHNQNSPYDRHGNNARISTLSRCYTPRRPVPGLAAIRQLIQ